MGYAPHALIAFGGTLGPANQPTEEWSCSIRATLSDNASFNAVEPTEAEIEDYLEHCTTVISNMFGSAAAKITNQAELDYVKVNAIANDGKYRDETTYGNYDLGIRGNETNFTYYKPFQVSKVVTLETGNSRGLAHRGRFYLPTPANLVNANGTISVSVDDVITFSTFIKNLQLVVDEETRVWRPAVVSPLGGVLGRWNPVTATSMDNVLDTQRRRTRQMARTRTSAPVN